MANRITKIILRGEIADLQAKMAVAAKSVADAGDKMTNASRESVKFRQGLTTLGNTAGKFGLAAAAGLGVAVLASARFDSAMSKVQAATHESAANMELLRAAAIKAGADTVFSATEAADAVTALSKAGVASGDILKGGLSGALSLASAGELEVASAAEIAATAMTQFGLAGKDIPHIADLLAAGAGKAQGEVSDMAAALKYVGPVAHQMGISIEETAGTIAELASQGIIGEQAGTSLRGMLTSLTSPSMLAAKTMKNLGIELYNSSGNFVGLEGVAGQLQDRMGGLTNAERDQALGRIFGNEQITAARILYAGGAEAVDKWTAAVNDQGYAAETASIKMDNLSGDLEQLKGSLETALIGQGQGAQGPLRNLVQGATDGVNALNALPASAKNAVNGLLLITAVTGGALWFGSKVIGGISSTRTALENLGVDATRVGRTLRTAFAAGAIIEGLDLIESSLDGIFGQELDTSKLGRSLTSLAQGKVTGEFLDKYGSNLEGFSDDVHLATDSLGGLARAAGKIPGVGDFLAAPPWQKSPKDAAKNIAKLDEALAGLVESGKADDAAAIFDQLTEAAERNGVSATKVKDQFEQYDVALDNLADSSLATSGAAKLMDEALNGLLNPTSKLGVAAAQSAEDQEALAKALEESRKAASETAHQFVGVGNKVDDAKVSLHDWITDLRKQAEALRDFTKNAQTAGKKGLKEGLIAELEAAGPAGALRMKQLADASETEIRRANKAWKIGQTAINDYVDTVGGVPPTVATDLQVNGVPVAITAVSALKRLLDDLHDRNIHIKVTGATNALLAEAAANAPVKPASGGRIVGPGTGTSDSIPAMISNGEYVIKAAAVDHYGPRLFDALNAMRYADGGMVGMPTPVSRPVSMGASGQGTISANVIAQLTRAILAARPLIGEQIVMPHNYNEFLRQQAENQRMSGIGGIPR